MTVSGATVSGVTVSGASGKAASELTPLAWLPARWYVLVLLVWWALRGIGLVAMRAFVDLDLDVPGLLVGMGLDALWVAGMLAPASAAASQPRAAVRRRLYAATFVTALLSTLFRATDIGSCYFALAHTTTETWAHISIGSLGYIRDPRVIAGLLAVAAVAAITTLFGGFDGRGRAIRLRTMATTVALGFGVPVIVAGAAAWHPHHWGQLPELQVLASGIEAKLGGAVRARIDPASVEVPTLSPAVVSILQRAGVLPPGTDPSARFPLLRRDFGHLDQLKARLGRKVAGVGASMRADGQPAPRPVNVLIILVESLSAGFTGLDPRSHHPQLMPNLARFAQDATSVQGYHNATSPTANGLIASLCGTLPPSAVGDLEIGGSVDGETPYRCIADVLRPYGYRSEFARGASKVYMACEATLRGHGFDAVWGREDLETLYPDRARNAWGFDDATLVDFLLDRITALEAGSAPWLMATLTVGSHLPGFPDPSCPQLAAAKGDNILAGYACTDRQIGR